MFGLFENPLDDGSFLHFPTMTYNICNKGVYFIKFYNVSGLLTECDLFLPEKLAAISKMTSPLQKGQATQDHAGRWALGNRTL